MRGRWLGLVLLASCGGEPRAAIEVPVVIVDAGAPRAADAPTARGARVPAAVGRWEGVGTQTGGDTWEMIVDITTTKSGPCATVEYPSLPCSGTWICGPTEEIGTVVAREKLEPESVGRCIDDGDMKMHVDDTGALIWEWVAGEESATARLTRVR